MALLTALVVLPMSVAGASAVPAPAGAPLYAWGGNANGQLGLGHNTVVNVPTRVGAADNWIQVATAAGGALALNAEGHIYTWGALWTAPQMGQGGIDNPNEGFVTVPTRLGTANDWEKIFLSGSTAAAINEQGDLYTWGNGGSGRLGHGDSDDRSVPTRVEARGGWESVTIAGASGNMLAITTDGELFAWGSGGSGQLGLGNFSSPNVPTRVGEENNWRTVAASGAHTAAINADGHLYMWGNNTNGQLGLGHNTTVNVPTRVGTADNWIDVFTSGNQNTTALNSDGEIYTWGYPGAGRLGRVVDTTNPQNLPGRVEDKASRWIAIGGGNGHTLAMTEDLRLYAWGTGGQGQLGLGGFSNQNTPTFILQSYGIEGFSQTGAGSHSMALIRTSPVEISEGGTITKNLQKPEGTTMQNDVTFSFAFERHSFNGNTTLVNQVPNIPNRSITLNSASPSTTASGITTTTDTVESLVGINFEAPGVFAWTVTELATTGVAPASNVVDSQAKYVMRVYVSQEGVGGNLYVYAVTIYRYYDDAGDPLAPPLKTDDFSFTNVYTRENRRDGGALTVAKLVTGSFADTTTLFDFDVTITRTAFCDPTITYTARVYTGAIFVRSYTLTSGTSTHIQLAHGQRIVFGDMLVGTQFNVTERAAPQFAASLGLLVGGHYVSVPPNDLPNMALSTGDRLLGNNQNSATFTNTHFQSLPTGIVTGNAPVAIPFIAAIGIVLLLASKYRRRIEELPLI